MRKFTKTSGNGRTLDAELSVSVDVDSKWAMSASLDEVEHIKETAVYIPIDAVFNKLTRGSAASLPACHVSTGRDTTSYIANHSKQSSWKISSKSTMAC